MFRITQISVRILLVLASMNSVAGAQSGGVAVVELFTSEGCSSCPPADELLTKIENDATASDAAVFTLAFHVDYWNRLGWTDRFSSSAFTQRQNDYAAKLKLDTIYTPQMIVNGHDEFVGSDSKQAATAIASALRQAAAVSVKAKAAAVSNQTASIDFTCVPAGSGEVVNVAVVEDRLSTAVRRGENAGRQLEHSSVVRWFSVQPLPADGHGSVVARLDGVAIEHARVIVFVQDSQSFSVRGAAATTLKQP